MKKVYRLGCLLVLMMAGSLQAGVTFSGIDGAISWVWVEGEDGTRTSGSGWECYFGSIASGHNGVETWFDDAAYTWTATVPLTMANAKLYAHCSSYYTASNRPFSIENNGQTLGYIANQQGEDQTYKAPIYWSENTSGSGDLGIFNQGDITLTLKEGIYNSMRLDGFFLTNGTIDLLNPPTTALDATSGYYWMQRPTFAGTLPVLTGPLTPVVNGTPTGVQYFVYRDGTQVSSSGSSFGVLDVSGNYDLEIRGANNEILCGASFTLCVPLVISGIDGAYGWVWVEGEKRNSGRGAVLEPYGYGVISGYGPGSPAPNNAVFIDFDWELNQNYATWNIGIPVPMANAKLTAHCSSYFVDSATRGCSIFAGGIDGTQLGSIWSNEGGEGWKPPIYWSASGNLGALAQGRMALTLKQNINAMWFDGFFISNADIDLPNPPTINNPEGTYWFMQRPTFTGTLPVLTAPVIPVVSGAPSGAKYYINGNIQPDDCFGKMDVNGTYHLEVRNADNDILCGASFVLVGGNPSWFGELTLGHRILLNKGLQIQALVGDGAKFSLARFAESNFTTANFGMCPWAGMLSGHLNPAWIGDGTAPTPPGPIPWSRMSAGGPAEWEIPYLETCVNLQYDDELENYEMSDSNFRQGLKNQFRMSRQQYPGTLAHTNNGGYPDSRYGTIQEVKDFTVDAKPDIVSWSWYPFTAAQPGGSHTTWYETLQKFRQVGLAGLDGNGNNPIPYACYVQGFSPPWAPHIPTESEMRMDQFSALAFGYKMVTRWVYTTTPYVSSGVSLFFNGEGDASPTPKFAEVASLNLQSRNLGPALLRLFSTDVRMKMGRHHGSKNHWYESGSWEVENTLPSGIAAWSTSADPYITNVSATNLGTCNTYTKDDLFSSWTVKLPGDVIIGFFKPLHEMFDGDQYSNQKYFMIVNGLTDFVGNAAACRQRIRLNFNFGSSGINRLLRMRRSDGQVEVVNLISDGGSLYHLDLELDGGTGDLFKYNTGAPFVGANPNDPTVTLLPGDANGDGMVDVGDLGILAANYGRDLQTEGVPSTQWWGVGDFNNDGKVDVGDLGVLAAHYGEGVTQPMNFDADYAQAFGTTVTEDQTSDAEAIRDNNSSDCSALGLPLITGLVLMGLMLVRLEE